MFCYMIIVFISIWLFLCLIKLLICFTICLLDRILLITLYLSFYHLIYLEGLMCFVQVFQVTSICSKFITCFRFRCEWVLSLFPNSRLSLKSIIGCFFHEIAKWEDCKVEIYNYVLCWLYSMTKSVVIALILLFILCGILLY